jgi:hypothetical protein
MLQFSMFGGYEGPLSAEKRCYLTVFGACELYAPTLARQLIAARSGNVNQPKCIFITLFGATEIKVPTLTEEFLDLREAIQNKALDLNQWDFYMAELDRWRSSSFMSVTLFAGFSETELPTEDEEIESLALQRHFGNISEDSGRILEMGIGQGGVKRRSIIQQAIATA